MPFHLRPLPPSPRSRHHPLDDDSDDDSDVDPSIPHAHSSARSRSSFLTPSNSFHSLPPSDHLLPHSLPTTAPTSPIPSRSSSPLPPSSHSFISSGSSSAYGSDTDEASSPLLRVRTPKPRWWSDEPRPWWNFTYIHRHRRRRRKRDSRFCGLAFRLIKGLVRLPYFPAQPTTIVLSLLLFSVFALLVTLILIHVLNPDKEPLPWREYCSVPGPPKTPPSLSSLPDAFLLDPSASPPDFPPPAFDSQTPVGIVLGVFSTDQAVERRMLIRSTWARHPHSRNGAGVGDQGRGTSRTIVRFILGRPRSKWERRIQLEMETYNDLIILPIPENMNSGKTHAFFNWAASNAWVPSPTSTDTPYPISYSNMTAMPPPPALHDPRPPDSNRPWVRPDFIVKADDDSFVMLSELEGRLRVEMNDAISTESFPPPPPPPSTTTTTPPLAERTITLPQQRDPLIYWGYLVKNRFMAGELYALSWSIVDWVAADPTIKGMIKGAEDKQVAKWMNKHPRASSIRWVSERCWIYDHPRAGTVYSHGYLFPSEVSRVRRAYKAFVQSLAYTNAYAATGTPSATLKSNPPPDSFPIIYRSLSHSTVSDFGSRYTPPLPNLTPLHSVEALVEGSAMSLLRDNIALGGAEAAWKQREGRKRRYDSKRIGGTVVVHFIKRNEWFLETALALLEGDEWVEGERRREEPGKNEMALLIEKVGTNTPSEDRDSNENIREAAKPRESEGLTSSPTSPR